MRDALAALLQVLVETLAALAAEPIYVSAIAQAALQFVRLLAVHIKK